jgi:hypothetical protein
MRLSFLAIASLSLASAAAAGSGDLVRGAAGGAKPVCTAELQKVAGTAGYAVARRCISGQAGTPAGQPVEDGLGQAENGASPVVISLFAAGVIGLGIATAIDDQDTLLPVSG